MNEDRNFFRILVVKAAGIGDLILAVPALRALRAKVPESKIDLLVTPKCSQLFKHSPYVDDIYVIQTQGMMNRITVSNLWNILRTVYVLRKKNYDFLINLYHLFSDRGASRMKLLCKAIGANLTLGRNTDGRGTFYDVSIKDSWGDPEFDQRHEVELNLDVVRLLGAEDPGRGLEFRIGDEERSCIQRLLARQGLQEKRGTCIVLNVGGDAPYKQWPEEYFAALGDLLTQKLSAQLFIVGGEGDRSVADRVISKMKHKPVDFAGKLNILELAALLERCDLMVTNDTGPMHLAAAVGRPVVALFGPGKPGRYSPYGPQGFHVVVHHPITCSPCTEFECEERTCMKKILPQEVFQKVVDRLSLKYEACS